VVDAPGVDYDAAEANLLEAGEHVGAAREAGGVIERERSRARRGGEVVAEFAARVRGGG
jgi:hypothetical protein